MLSPSLLEQPLAPRTVTIVGRDEELKVIRQAVSDKGSQQVLYYVADGGMGKTRLLEEVDQIKKPVLSPPIVDLYHQENHSPGGLRQAIVVGLGEKKFSRYNKQRTEFEEKRNIGRGGKELENMRAALDKIFVEEYNQVAARQRVVLRFDTLELLQYEHDSVQKTCLVDDVDTVIKNWLLFIIPQLKNTVTIFAGRPRPQTEKEFAERLTKAGCVFKRHLLPAFTEEEAEEYLRLMQQKYPDELDQIFLSDSPPDIYSISEGKPIRLALIIDLLRHEEPFDLTLPKEAVDKVLVERLMRLPEPFGSTIRFLLQARKGLDKTLLQYLSGQQVDFKPSGILQQMLGFAITKTYQGDTSRLFLHDELYDLYDRYFLDDPRYRHEFFRPLRGYYQQELDSQINKVINTPQEAKEQVTKVENIKLALLYYLLQCEPDEAYHRYYKRWDEEAIKQHETGFDMQLRDEVLRFYNRYAFDKSSPFYDQYVADLVKAEKIHRDCAVRWVKRHLARGAFSIAKEAAENVRHNTSTLFKWDSVDDPIYKAGLLTAWSEALLYIGADEQTILTVVEEAIKLLTADDSVTAEIDFDELQEPDDEAWQRKQILGKAYNNRGYLYWAYGRYGFAFDDFRRALGYFRQVQLQDERANTLTNLAYVMALLGRVDTAKYHIEEAIAIRQQLDKNKRYTIALSRNTRGRVYTLGGDFDIGIEECRQALTICEDVDEQRGIGMACIALGFSLRRRGEQWKRGSLVYTPRRAEADFIEAEIMLQRAITIFKKIVPEPIRLWEAYNESGSLFCDWAYLSWIQKMDAVQATAQYERSIKYQQEALTIAEDKKLAFQITDSHDDLAQVHHDYGRLLYHIGNSDRAITQYEEAQKCLIKIEETLIPKSYQFVPGGQSDGSHLLPESGLAYWQSLGKLYLQLGVWEAHKLEDREVTFGERSDVMRRCIRFLAISFAYFQRYGPQSVHLQNTSTAFTRRLGSLQISSKLAREEVEAVEEEYGLNLRVLRDTIDDTLGL